MDRLRTARRSRRATRGAASRAATPVDLQDAGAGGEYGGGGSGGGGEVRERQRAVGARDELRRVVRAELELALLYKFTYE